MLQQGFESSGQKIKPLGFPLPRFDPLPSRVHCTAKSQASLKTFKYRMPTSSNPFPPPIRKNIIDKWTAQFEANQLRDGLDFPTFKSQAQAFKTKYDGDASVEGYKSSEE